VDEGWSVQRRNQMDRKGISRDKKNEEGSYVCFASKVKDDVRLWMEGFKDCAKMLRCLVDSCKRKGD
jgi:hypothetical protein